MNDRFSSHGSQMMMPATIESLKAKIAQVEKEIIEIRQGLEQLSTTAVSRTKEHPPAGFHPADRTGWQKWLDEWFQQMGIMAQPMGAKKLQALMRGEDVRPEDHLLSQGIIAMREE